jgi:hypothetical protein
VAVRRDMTCAPCYLQKPADCVRHLACLTGISVGSVYRACERLLPVAARRSRAPERRVKRRLTATV